jgi:cytidine deaminase
LSLPGFLAKAARFYGICREYMWEYGSDEAVVVFQEKNVGTEEVLQYPYLI